MSREFRLNLNDRAVLAAKLASRGPEIFRRIFPRALAAKNSEALGFCVSLLTLRGVADDAGSLADLREEFGPILIKAFTKGGSEDETECYVAQLMVLLDVEGPVEREELQERLRKNFDGLTDSEFIERLACLELAQNWPSREVINQSGRRTLLKRKLKDERASLSSFLKRKSQ